MHSTHNGCVRTCTIYNTHTHTHTEEDDEEDDEEEAEPGFESLVPDRGTV